MLSNVEKRCEHTICEVDIYDIQLLQESLQTRGKTIGSKKHIFPLLWEIGERLLYSKVRTGSDLLCPQHSPLVREHESEI